MKGAGEDLEKLVVSVGSSTFEGDWFSLFSS
jgi:hypothetical protein